MLLLATYNRGYPSHEVTRLWVIQADTLKEVQTIVNSSSCRTGDGMLADSGAGRGVASEYWAWAFLKLGLLYEIPHTASDGSRKAAHTRKSPPYPATHNRHSIFGTVGNTTDPSPDARAVQNGRGKLMWLPQHFRFLGIALYGFLQYKLPLFFSRLFWQIRPTQ